MRFLLVWKYRIQAGEDFAVRRLSVFLSDVVRRTAVVHGDRDTSNPTTTNRAVNPPVVTSAVVQVTTHRMVIRVVRLSTVTIMVVLMFMYSVPSVLFMVFFMAIIMSLIILVNTRK